MRPSVTNTTTHTPHKNAGHASGYTTHTHTKNILQRRKMLASTIQFSHTTPTTTNHTNSDQQTVSPKPEQPPTHHTTTVMQPAGTMCCPRHPTVHQQFINVWNLRFVYNHSPDRHLTSQVCVHLDISQTVAAPRSGTQPPKTQNCGPQNKAP